MVESKKNILNKQEAMIDSVAFKKTSCPSSLHPFCLHHHNQGAMAQIN